jgi:hypothetical protein
MRSGRARLTAIPASAVAAADFLARTTSPCDARPAAERPTSTGSSRRRARDGRPVLGQTRARPRCR